MKRSLSRSQKEGNKMKVFKGRPVVPGNVTAEALVSHGGLNTLASFQKALQFGDKKATCGDQNNPDLYGKQMFGKALCLPKTIGSTTGGLVLYCACSMGRQPACMLFLLKNLHILFFLIYETIG
jgi:predicted aconitase with swiveling domain